MSNDKLYKQIKRKLKSLEVRTQSDLVQLMIAVVARRIGVDDIRVKNHISQTIEGLDIHYKRMDPSVIDYLSDFDLSLFVTEADSFLEDLKRNTTGSFYTPIEWVKYMTKLSVCDWMVDRLEFEGEEKIESPIEFVLALSKPYALDENHKLKDLITRFNVSEQTLHSIDTGLKDLKVIDIACGAGAFLLEMVDLLASLTRNIKRLLGKTCDYNKVALDFINGSVAGIDLQPEPLAVYTLCLMWRHAGPDNWKLSPLIALGNSLEEETYRKHPKIKNILDGRKFDIAIGNPPYLGEKGNTQVFKKIRKTEFGQKHYEGKMDLSYFFALKSLELINKLGRLTYLTTNYFITADGAMKFRKTLEETTWFAHILNFNSYPVFREALGQHNMIYTLKPKLGIEKEKKTLVRYVHNETYREKVHLECDPLMLSGYHERHVKEYMCDAQALYTSEGTISILSDDSHKAVLDIYENFSDIRLRDVFEIKQGIVSGADQVSGLMLRSKLPKDRIDKYAIEKGDPIFVFDNDDPKLFKLEAEVLKPFYKNSDIDAYKIKPRTKRKIIYLDGYNKTTQEDYPRIIEHLKTYKPVLEGRREVKTGTRPWFALQWPRNRQVFEGEKIVVPQRCKINRFAYTDKAFYCSADVYYFKEKTPKSTWANQKDLDIQAWMYYLGVLNSSILYLWLYQNGKRKGELLELYAKPLLDTAVPCYWAYDWQCAISQTVNAIMETDCEVQVKKYKKEIDQILFRAMDVSDQQADMVENFINRHMD